MNRLIRILSIISSIILIINYIEINLGAFVFRDSQVLLKLETGLFRIIFIISFIIAYFCIARYFNGISEKKIETLIYVGIFLGAIAQIVIVFNSYALELTRLISSIFFFANFIIIFIWGIFSLKLDSSVDKNIKFIKIFVISILTVVIINFLGTPILIYNQLMNFNSLLLLLYIIPYSILTVFFIRNEKFPNW